LSDDFEGLLSRIRKEAEEGIKAELARRGFVDRSVFGMFMPLIINIITEADQASITISKDGSIEMKRRLSQKPDITLRADFGMLSELYHSRSRQEFRAAESQGKIEIRSNTAKGQLSEARFRELLGG
jgi:hypothetical protein